MFIVNDTLVKTIYNELCAETSNKFLILFEIGENESGWRESNPRPLGPEPSALATALQPEGKKKPLYGAIDPRETGLEPVISGLTGRRDNQLHHSRSS